MILKPGAKGPKPRRAVGSVEKPTMVMVRPWKPFSQTMTSAWFLGTPLTS
jgi:hypothetical protein